MTPPLLPSHHHVCMTVKCAISSQNCQNILFFCGLISITSITSWYNVENVFAEFLMLSFCWYVLNQIQSCRRTLHLEYLFWRLNFFIIWLQFWIALVELRPFPRNTGQALERLKLCFKCKDLFFTHIPCGDIYKYGHFTFFL